MNMHASFGDQNYETQHHAANVASSAALLAALRANHAPRLRLCYPSPAVILPNPLLEIGRKYFEAKLVKTADLTDSVAIIISAVSNYFDVSTALLMGRRRSGDLVKPRQIIMYLASELTQSSYPSIGRSLNRDHTTVLYGHRLIREKIKRDHTLRIQVDTIRAQLGFIRARSAAEFEPDRLRRVYQTQTWTAPRVSLLLEWHSQKKTYAWIAKNLGHVSPSTVKRKITEMRNAARLVVLQ